METVTVQEWADENVYDTDAFLIYLENGHVKATDEMTESDLEDKKTEFEDAYQGCHDTFAEFVEEMVREIEVIPDWVSNHIDWESVARDWSHDYWEQDGHVFRNL